MQDVEALGIIHGFCTRSTLPPASRPGEGDDFLSTFSLRDCIAMEQVHSDGIHVVQDDTDDPKAGDGLIMMQQGVAGIIRTADCVPLILCEARSRMAAIVHAGWRGTVLGIAGKAVRMMAELGAEPSLMQALIGPCIGPCCYEVGQDVVGHFTDVGFSETVVGRRNGSLFLDLRKANAEGLKAAGVKHIQILDLCTRCRPDLFFSARRNESGRQFSFAAVIG
ncbi:MAG TPA: peptidoglycan editing factor PgeF [Deltaproteobacteria bacterium]|nr:peptidoglycan editing factor PgeF [Deltaproteobacteria bacterium]